MRSYIIYLPEFENSKKWASSTYNSAIHYAWSPEYFEGFNGKRHSLDEFDLKADPKYKKGCRLLKNPGVVGCFLSHYHLWKKSVSLNESICILEHDVTIHDRQPDNPQTGLVKLASGPKAKKMYLGEWWGGSMAYIVTTESARKLINHAEMHGVMPSDTMLCTGIIDLRFHEMLNKIVTYTTDNFSFTHDF